MILVCGDVTVDWNIARGREHLGDITTIEWIWGSDVATRASSQPGGAALVTDLLRTLCATQPSGWTVTGPAVPRSALRNPADDGYTRSYAIWSMQPRTHGDPHSAWRATEFWGTDPAGDADTPTPPDVAGVTPTGIVIDDAGLGFRNDVARWPAALTECGPQTRWVVLKMAHPLDQPGALQDLIHSLGDRLVVVVPVSDLRKGEALIGYGLSWEQVSSDIVAAVRGHPHLAGLPLVVVTMGVAGAVIVRGTDGVLIFDPLAQGDDWASRHPGFCVGYTSCYVASLVRALIADPDNRSLVDPVKQGVHAARALHLAGYGADSEGSVADLRFPHRAVVAALDHDDIPLGDTVVPPDVPEWTILSRQSESDLSLVAERVVVEGPETALGTAPLERIGRWSSVDRLEIQNIRSLGNIIAEYVAERRPERPLSIAVFGPPGCGKSFAVKQLARSLVREDFAIPVFNLSQFEDPELLTGAFHRIRDCGLSRQLPIVFWDEFDTELRQQALGWLPHFLAPMQDGEFMENGRTHPLGRAIFVFAGGSCASREQFSKAAEAAPKGLDFESRLRGFLNVLGPDPQGSHDRAFVLRRALLLRSLLQSKAQRLFRDRGRLQIDRGVLQAFLGVAEYRHGARSMEAIIDMSLLSGKLGFERSSLPAAHQLNLHVDAAEFLRLVSS